MGYYAVGISQINDPSLVSGAGTFGQTADQVSAGGGGLSSLLASTAAAAGGGARQVSPTQPARPPAASSSDNFWSNLAQGLSLANKLTGGGQPSGPTMPYQPASSFPTGLVLGGVAVVGLTIFLLARRRSA